MKHFSKRLEHIMNFYDVSASAFAEHIGVQRSSISHILSGRNKPSLDFVMKLLEAYPEVEIYWLLNGKGQFPVKEKTNTLQLDDEEKTTTQHLFSEAATGTSKNVEAFDKTATIHELPHAEKTIERIVIFYSDGSFSNFKNST